MQTRRNSQTFPYVVRLLTTLCVLVYALVPPFVYCTCRGVCIASVVSQAACRQASNVRVSKCCRMSGVSSERMRSQVCSSLSRNKSSKSCMALFDKASAVTVSNSSSEVSSGVDFICSGAFYRVPSIEDWAFLPARLETYAPSLRLHLALRVLRI